MRLEELKSLASSATPGPWTYKVVKGFPTVDLHNNKVSQPFFDMCCDNEAKFVAAANPATILKLMGLIEMMKEALEFYKEAGEWINHKWIDHGTTARQVLATLEKELEGL